MQQPTFKSGTTWDYAARVLADRALAARSAGATSAGRPATEWATAYLNWARESVSQLGNMMLFTDIERQVMTRAYWAIRQLGQRDLAAESRQTILQIGDELQYQANSFTELQVRVETEHKRWVSPFATLAVPDTNMFLDDDEQVQDIDWPSVLQTSGLDVRLVVPLVVIHELDKLKLTGRVRVQEKARAALRWLATQLPPSPDQTSDRFGNEDAPRVTIEVYVHDGPTRPEDPDGLIIEMTDHISSVAGVPAVLATKDLGMSLRAAAGGVAYLLLRKEGRTTRVVRRSSY